MNIIVRLCHPILGIVVGKDCCNNYMTLYGIVHYNIACNNDSITIISTDIHKPNVGGLNPDSSGKVLHK